MSSSIAVIADPDTVTGFKLGGVKEGYPVEDMNEAKTTLEKIFKQDFSIIITTEKIGDELRKTIERLTKTSALPMIIEVPDKTGPSERKTDPIGELIRRVIGVEMVK